MAVATWSSNTALVKAVLLPLILVLLAVADGASSKEDGTGLAKSGGRFSETPVGRKLLLPIRACGQGSAPDFDCKEILRNAYNATCCTDKLGNQGCWDVGAFWLDKCGSCTNKCKVGEACCNGVCADLTSDKNNCGVCGNKCRGKSGCKFGLCDY